MRTLAPLSIEPDVVFHKRRHSALVGSGLPSLADRARHPPADRLRHPHRAVLRDDDAARVRLGFEVDFVTEATLTFAMTARDGRV